MIVTVTVTAAIVPYGIYSACIRERHGDTNASQSPPVHTQKILHINVGTYVTLHLTNMHH